MAEPMARPPAGERSVSVLGLTVVAALGGLLFGWDTGVIGGSQLYFTEHFGLTPTQQGWAVSSALIGCLLGAAVAGMVCARYSRKYALILSALLFTVSAWGSGIPDSLGVLVLFRVLGGLGVGIASMAAPMYIAEISPPEHRGRLVSWYQLAIVSGFFLVFVATYFIGGGSTAGLSASALEARHQFNVMQGWRWMFWSELVPAVVFLGLLLRVPHTPRWLMLHGREDEARVVLRRLGNSSAEVERQIGEILCALHQNRAASGGALRQLLSGRLKWLLLLGVLLSVAQQVTGINAVLYYGAEIFSTALGYGPQDALKQQLLLGTVNLVCTFVAMRQVDRWGRRPLLLLGLAGMAAGMAVLALAIFQNRLGLMALVGMLGFVGAFALSMGPVTWVLLSEIFPNRVRAAAMSVAVAAQWLFNALVAQSFPAINASALNAERFHGSLPFVLFGAMCLLSLALVWRFVPETRRKSLEALEARWSAAT